MTEHEALGTFETLLFGLLISSMIIALVTLPIFDGQSLVGQFNENIATATAEAATQQTIYATNTVALTATRYWADPSFKPEPTQTALVGNESRGKGGGDERSDQHQRRLLKHIG